MACGIELGHPPGRLLSPEVDFVPVGTWNTDGLIIVSPFASKRRALRAGLIPSGFPAIFAGDRDGGPAVVADELGESARHSSNGQSWSSADRVHRRSPVRA